MEGWILVRLILGGVASSTGFPVAELISIDQRTSFVPLPQDLSFLLFCVNISCYSLNSCFHLSDLSVLFSGTITQQMTQ